VSALAAPVTVEGIEVRDGRFRIDVELPLVDSHEVWFDVAVRANGDQSFSVITGRSKAIAAPLIGACWSTLGDSGSNPATNFIGTTDAQAFEVRTANARSLRIEPSAQTTGSPALPITSNTIAGSSANAVTAGVRGATIAGGGVPTGTTDPDFQFEGPNRVSDHYGLVGGGYANRAGNATGNLLDAAFATVGGGLGNVAGGTHSTVGGGTLNTASNVRATVAGGESNRASGDAGTVSGGQDNIAAGPLSSVVGGLTNVALGNLGTVAGGLSNCAGATLSWAGGRQAKVRPPGNPGSGSCSGLPSYPGGEGDFGTFIWADNNGVDFVSTGENQFLVRAGGGAAFNSNDPVGNALRVNGTLRVDGLGTAGSLALCRNSSLQLASCSSSERYKFDIDDLELGLATALRLHAVGYRWKGDGAADVGFVAEEIAAIDERLITRNDRGEVEGVKYDRLTAVLANAVQELAAQGSLAAEALARVEAENATLRSESADVRARLERIEALLSARAGAER
jgi:hypothetical protein